MTTQNVEQSSRNQKRLTVLQALPALESGGVERGTLEVAKYLVEQGHRSLVMSAGGRMVEQLLREGSEHFGWPIGKKSPLTLQFIPRLRRFLLEQEVDILHARSRMPGWICYLAWKSMNPETRPRFVTTVHGLYSVTAYSSVMAKGEKVIAVSETVRDYILEHYPSVEPERIEVILRGVDSLDFPYGFTPGEDWKVRWRRDFPQLSGKKILTLPGRITRLKGHDDFIELIARLREKNLPVHGLIVGGAAPRKRRYLNELQALVRRFGLESGITFTGQRQDMREIMAMSQIVLSLSRQPESFGRTVLEAVSLGVPVVGYNHGGVGEQLAAILPRGAVPVGDVAAATAIVQRWLEHPPTIPRDQPFTLQRMLKATLEVYEEQAQDRPHA